MGWAEVKKINSNMKVPLNEGGVKIVKSVQRGRYSGDQVNDSVAGYSTADKMITINAVDMSKSLLIIEGVIVGSYYSGAYLASSTAIGVPYHSSSYYDYGNGYGVTTYYWPSFAWQVIEFY